MSRLLVLGATGSLGGHVLRLGVEAGHAVTAFVRTPAKVPSELRTRVSVHPGDLNEGVPLDLVRDHDAVINCAGHVKDGERFVRLVDGIVRCVEVLAESERPVCWFLAGAALLDLDAEGHRGVDLPAVQATYWPHRLNFERLCRSRLDWRLLCPGPMADREPIGLDRLRVSIDRLPVDVATVGSGLTDAQWFPVFASVLPQMIVPYADAAALMLANLDRGNAMSRHRVGMALPVDDIVPRNDHRLDQEVNHV